MTTQHIFKGYIMNGRDGDAKHILFLCDTQKGDLEDPLAEQVYNLVRWRRQQISVSYHITDAPQTEDELTLRLVTKLCGGTYEGEATTDYGHRYSELTGYLWTDEEFKVGGHDVIAELRSHKGKWCYMIVQVHDQ